MKRLLLVVLASIVLTGCAEYATYTPSASDLTALAEHYYGEDKPAVQGTAVARYLTAEAARVEQEVAQAAMIAAESTRQAAADRERRQYLAMTAEAQATKDAVTLQATQAAMDAQTTRQAWAFQVTQTAEAMKATQTAEAMKATQTAEALRRAATATAQYRADLATATAQAIAFERTATRQAWEGKVTATAEAVQATAAAYAATATRAQEKREIVLGYGRDYGIPVVLLAVIVGLAWLTVYGLREYKKRPVVYPRNFLGDADPMAVPVEGGGYTFVDLDRQPGPVLQVLPDGRVNAPQLRSAGQEERTTARDQAVDAATRPRLGGGYKVESPPLPAPPEAPAPGLRSVRVLRRLDQAQRAGFLPPTLVESLQADWEEV